MAEKRTYDISWVTLWRILFFVTLVTLMFYGRRILLGLFLAIVISSGLEFIVSFLERRGIPRTIGVILIFLTGALVAIAIIYTVVPLVIVDLNNIFAKIEKLGASPVWGQFITPKTTQSLSAFVNRISAQFFSGGASPLGAFSDIVGSVALGISVLISSFYLSLSRNGVERFILAIMPADYESTAIRVYERSIRRIGFWFQSQLLLSLIMGGLVLAALLILGVRYAFILAFLTGVFELVPFVGPILAGSASVLSALTSSPELAVTTLIVFVLIHQIESHLLVPILIGRNVGLHPVVVIIALLMGAEIGGFLGILIAVPSAVVFQEIIENWSDRKKMPAVAAL
ncbi:MAG: AI-2E family transporter [Patescibacteria group bacterium]